MKKTSIARLFEAVGLAVNNTLEDADLQKKMANYGFPQKRLLEGQALLDQAQQLHQTKEQYYDERWDISSQIKADMKAAREQFIDHVQVARVAFRREPEILHKFRIKRIAGNTWDWTEQALTFYTKLEEYSGQMARHDVQAEELQQAKAAVEALLVMKGQRQKKKGAAEDTTHERNQAIKALRNWLTEFHASARLALKQSPQLLEIYGIMVPSE